MKGSQEEFLNGNFIIKDHSTRPVIKPRRRWEAVVQRDMSRPRNMRMEEMSRQQRRIEVSSEGGQGPEGAVGP